MKDIVSATIVIFLISFCAFVAGRKTAKDGAGETIITRVDTLVIRDTMTVYKPKFVTRRVIDSVLVPVTDSVYVRDTLYAVLEREQVTWEDSLSRVWASGIKPQVDSVTHFIQERIITRETVIRKDSRWGIGIQGGVGVGLDGLTPYIGVGLQYNLLSW